MSTISKVRLVVLQNSKAVVNAGARKFVDAMKAQPKKFVGGVGTGSTLEACGLQIVTLVNQEAVDTSGLELFGLDEYIGLKPIDLPLSYTGILRNIYCRGLGLPQERLHMPDWRTNYPMRTSQFFEREIMKANGIDLQMLGLGVNGHVGFNEPPARQGSLTHVERLSQLTRERNLRSVMAAPERAITQGIATIRRAKALLMLAYGQDKAIAANNMLFEPASPMCPASLLLPHADLTLMVDLETASLFPKPYFELGEYNLELPLS